MNYNFRILNEENAFINYLFYKYNALLNILRYLLQYEINQEYIQEYTLETEKAYLELETAKKQISDKYKPKELQNKSYNFTFDFDNCMLTFEEN